MIMAGPGRCAATVRQQPGRAIARYQVCVLLATIMLMLHRVPSAQADILVYQMLNDQIIEEFRDFPGTFGGEIPDTGMKVLADRGEPADGCTEMKKPPNITSKFAVVIARYNCSFEVKVRNAQQAGYAMAIIHNVGSNDLEHMSASHPQDLLIPSVFVGENTGRSIIEAYTYEHDYALVVTGDIPFNISNNLIIPFAIVVGLCFIIMVLFMIIRCIRERRRTLRHRLPARALKKIGIVKFAKGMKYDTCAICLDDFVENERLRVLPCRHAYHAQCIDPWLTKNRRVCPICKRRVIVRGERREPRRRWSSGSNSSSEMDETSPLLTSAASNQPTGAPVVPTSSSSSQPGAPPDPSPSVPQGTASAAVIETSPRLTLNHLLPQQQQQQIQQNAAPTSHVVNVLPSDDDDELLDDRNVPNARWLGHDRTGPEQQQPVNDSPYSPIGDEAALSRWERFKRLFTRTAAQDDDDGEDDVGEHVEPAPPPPPPVATVPTVIGSSNNILNAHLAGSFHNSEDTTDDELLGAIQRDQAKARQFRSAPDMPSTSVGGRVGVAALPNVNFNLNQQTPAYYQALTVGAAGAGGTGATATESAGNNRRHARRSRPRARQNPGNGSHIV